MFNKLIIGLADTHNRLKEIGMDEWCICNCSVPVKILNELYDKFMADGIAPIESISNEEKMKYWNIGKKYHPDQPSAIRASKAAYVLALITSN